MATTYTQQPQGDQNPEKHMEDRIRARVESGSMMTGEVKHEVRASTGEDIEIDPLRLHSAHEIYDKIRHNFALKDEAQRRDALLELTADMGLEHEPTLAGETLEALDVTDPTSEATEAADMNVDPKLAMEQQINKLIKQLAEDIFDALVKAKKSIEIIKPESIGSKTVSHLSEAGDANFVVAPDEGEPLLASLREQDADFRMLRKNNHGFVLENDTLGFKAVFVYAERLDHEGLPLKPEPEAVDGSDREDLDDQPTTHTTGQASNRAPGQE